MNQQAEMLKQKILANRAREEDVPGLKSVKMIRHGSDVMVSVKTPLGHLYRTETTFIGSDGLDRIYLAPPKISKIECEEFFQQGYWITIKAISEHGEGAQITLKTRIKHLVTDPVRLVVVDIPVSATLTQLRQEPRYEVNLTGIIQLGSRKLTVELKDISSSGCCFLTELHGPQFSPGMPLSIRVVHPSSGEPYRLSGVTKNIVKSGNANQCGVLFDVNGGENAKSLLSKLIFDGSKLSFKKLTT